MKTARSASTDSSTSESSAASSSAVRTAAAAAAKAKTTSTKPEVTPVRSRETTTSATTAAATPEKKPFQSRFLPNHTQEKKEETESSSEEETSSEESEEEEEEVVVKPTVKPVAPAVREVALRSDTTRVSQARDSVADNNRRSSRDDTHLRGGYSTPSYTSRTYERESSPSKYSSSVRTRPTRDQTYEEPKYGSSNTGSTTG